MTLTLLPGGHDATPEDLRTRMDRIRKQRVAPAEPANPMSPSAFEQVTRQMVEAIADDVHDIRDKLNNLVFVLISAVVLDAITRMLGG
jgi:hypothetical protein